jgi:hypothetical protein
MREEYKVSTHLATIAAAGVISAAYRVAGRTPEDARNAIIAWISTPHIPGTRLLTVGDVDGLTDWEPNTSISEISKRGAE